MHDVGQAFKLLDSAAYGLVGEFGGLGSSHTAPCGAAVPARPPTHCPSY